MTSRFLFLMIAALCGCAAGSVSRGSPSAGSPSTESLPPKTIFPHAGVIDTIAGGSRVYLDHEVERPAVVIPERIGPLYPRALRRSGIEGRVEVRMVIDTAGRVEMGTVGLVLSNHPAFTESIRDLLPKLRFSPAQRGGRPVRTWTQMSFDFRVGML